MDSFMWAFPTTSSKCLRRRVVKCAKSLAGTFPHAWPLVHSGQRRFQVRFSSHNLPGFESWQPVESAVFTAAAKSRWTFQQTSSNSDERAVLWCAPVSSPSWISAARWNTWKLRASGCRRTKPRSFPPSSPGNRALLLQGPSPRSKKRPASPTLLSVFGTPAGTCSACRCLQKQRLMLPTWKRQFSVRWKKCRRKASPVVRSHHTCSNA
mmetsp:Transcript_50064/g.154689  ORF Transcript_50064/g.154689 Transcript_50064/m.154689 type:complete len:209 (+) Transcript_50064:258-884(+)